MKTILQSFETINQIDVIFIEKMIIYVEIYSKEMK